MPLVAPLVALGTWALVMWVIALASARAVIMGYISGALSGLPFPLDKLAGPVKSLAQGITNVCGKLEAGVDRLIGAAWHALARYADSIWHGLVTDTHFALGVAEQLLGMVHAHARLRSIVHNAVGTAQAVLPRVKRLEKEYHGIEHRVKTLEREIAHGIGHDLRVHIKALEKWEKAAKGQLATDEKAITQTLPGELTDLENFIKAIPGTRYLDWAAGIVTAALGLGVVNLFRCPTFLGKTLARGCGLWNALEDLFGLFIDALLLTHLCDLPKWIEEIFSPLLGDLTALISSAANSLCAQSNADWAPLDVPNGPLPPAQTLYLPDHFG